MDIITPYVEAIKRRFLPAKDESEATHFFTTIEVLHAVSEIYPNKDLSEDMIYKALFAAGFALGIPPGIQSLQFRWLMRAI